MEFFEPRSCISRRSINTVFIIAVSLFSFHSYGSSSSWSKDLSDVSFGFMQNNSEADQFLKKAISILNGKLGMGLMADSRSMEPMKIVSDKYATTVKFDQKYNSIPVVNGQTYVHFNSNGDFRSVRADILPQVAITSPSVKENEITQIIANRFGANVRLSQKPDLVLFPKKDSYRLAYRVFTSTGDQHIGRLLFIDALDGSVLVEAPRIYDLDESKVQERSIVYSADTPEARKPDRLDEDGAPTDLNMQWYVKAIEKGKEVGPIDESIANADRNARLVLKYYSENFGRDSFDDKGSDIVSIVHIGKNWANAFWADEFKVMGYGDGDGEYVLDMTKGIDVAAHEMTHAITSSTANLMYQAESGALNESYSDFFGKMVDYQKGNWYLGEKVMGPKLGRKATRNMIHPEEFKQPGDNESPLRVPTEDSFCFDQNDYCGVHRNSGIPNRVAALITEQIGKEPTEHLFYHVLTQRLKEMSDFRDARIQTEDACNEIFGEGSEECVAVTAVYDEVKISREPKKQKELGQDKPAEPSV